ncbi:VIT1/CCC1 transporter family protein [Cupriavidus consociatus]|uniref:VIT1/CCC1 transporter family protein n=1 Tax=Cupriavidus consociatus TaxID=2821357 RepID=UPI001AE33F90|nr:MULTISPECIES: VIT1/CCC1 transporter family protein [unclassified Cupriavidus]MBP0621679.1 VIT1/CCC1 transporter family protein [Cupriavidus sp. LEh25]MDK2658354.1 VIT1/CCC1 transporter family protein [Cupriavidus sp. LEh21]
MPLTSVPKPTGFGARLRHLIRRPSGNALRAAVLGVNDGLVSSFCLVMGLEGAAATREAVILAGLAGLTAGACSMALGEWLSVTNSREMNNKRLRDMAHEIAHDTASARRRLVAVLSGKGMPSADAERAADEIMRDPRATLDTFARDVLGINPQERGGNPLQAAVISFVLYSSGALVPLLPFLVTAGPSAQLGSIIACLCGLGLVGWGTSSFNGRPGWFSALRQILIGGMAASFTYGLGMVFGSL